MLTKYGQIPTGLDVVVHILLVKVKGSNEVKRLEDTMFLL
jgi:hypothetical protein